MTVALLATFVFQAPVFVPLVALVVAVGAIFGPRANALHLAFDALVARRLPSAEERIPASTIRLQDALVAISLGLASLAFLANVDGLGWALTLLAAGATLLAATTGFHVSSAIRERFRREHD